MSIRCVFFHSDAIPKRAECAECAYFRAQYCMPKRDYADSRGGRVKFGGAEPSNRATFLTQHIFEKSAPLEKFDDCFYFDASKRNFVTGDTLT